jgi:hypothetical protein
MYDKATLGQRLVLGEIGELLLALGASKSSRLAANLERAENRALTPISGLRMRASAWWSTHVQGRPPQR